MYFVKKNMHSVLGMLYNTLYIHVNMFCAVAHKSSVTCVSVHEHICALYIA